MGGQPDYLIKVLDRALAVAQLPAGRTPVVVGFSKLRIKPQGLTIVGKRFFVRPEFIEGQPSLTVSLGIIRVNLDCLSIFLDSSFVVAAASFLDTAIAEVFRTTPFWLINPAIIEST